MHGPLFRHETASSWLAAAPGSFGLGWIVQAPAVLDTDAAAAPAEPQSGRKPQPQRYCAREAGRAPRPRSTHGPSLWAACALSNGTRSG